MWEVSLTFIAALAVNGTRLEKTYILFEFPYFTCLEEPKCEQDPFGKYHFCLNPIRNLQDPNGEQILRAREIRLYFLASQAGLIG